MRMQELQNKILPLTSKIEKAALKTCISDLTNSVKSLLHVLAASCLLCEALLRYDDSPAGIFLIEPM
jgi:hypothetical protein